MLPWVSLFFSVNSILFPLSHKAECLNFFLPMITVCDSVSGRSVYSVSSYSRWLRDNPGKATVKWRWRDGQGMGGRVNRVALAWMTRANSGLLIPVPSTLPLFLLANSTATVRSNWRPGRHYYPIHTQHLTNLSSLRREEGKGKRLLVPFLNS